MSIDNQVPASFVTTFRTDIRKVATLVKWLRSYDRALTTGPGDHFLLSGS